MTDLKELFEAVKKFKEEAEALGATVKAEATIIYPEGRVTVRIPPDEEAS